MTKRLCVPAGIAALGVWCARAQAAPGLESADDPYPGVHHEVWSDPALPARIHLVTIDLSAAELTLFATAEGERGTRTSAFASSKGAQIGINGGPFAPSGYAPIGLAMGNSAVWAGTADDAANGFLRFARVGERTEAAIVPPADVVAAADLPDGTQGVISGRPMLVRAGQPVTGFDCDDEVAIPCLRAPRTAIAVSADGRTMWLAVVDGWQAGSIGMTAMELAGFLDARGVHDALALDGGGASTLVLGGVASSPSDGVERTVANHLAVRWGNVPDVSLVGFIRERDVFEGAYLAGAVVTLDDGRTDTTATDGLYNFADVSPRYACVTARLTGYRTETRCKQIDPTQNPNYNSIAMFPCSDFPDGCTTPPDAGVPDAASFPDGGGPGDGGNPAGDGGIVEEPPGGCGGCRTTGPSGIPAITVFGVAFGALALRRRRRSRDGRAA